MTWHPASGFPREATPRMSRIGRVPPTSDAGRPVGFSWHRGRELAPSLWRLGRFPASVGPDILVSGCAARRGVRVAAHSPPLSGRGLGMCGMSAPGSSSLTFDPGLVSAGFGRISPLMSPLSSTACEQPAPLPGRAGRRRTILLPPRWRGVEGGFSGPETFAGIALRHRGGDRAGERRLTGSSGIARPSEQCSTGQAEATDRRGSPRSQARQRRHRGRG